MRIQHNILAMNAYRNYNTNTSALAKNLEKLSSGYKINRAGDDAAGLAISEKMRAQITGLNAASKNVKDGISLVKTAEGAMQEIQDMLNRMDYLATQSANGTYDDPVDRLNLQKEVDALKTEINRIADSANFNGINLLDGSMQDGKITGAKYESVDAADILGLIPPELNKGQPAVDSDKTIVEADAEKATPASFSVKLDNLNAVKDETAFKLNIGGKEIAVDGVKEGMNSDQIAELFNGKEIDLTDDNGNTVTFKISAQDNILNFKATESVAFNPPKDVTFTTSASQKATDDIVVTDKETKVMVTPYAYKTGKNTVAMPTTTITGFTNFKLTDGDAAAGANKLDVNKILDAAKAKGLSGSVTVNVSNEGKVGLYVGGELLAESADAFTGDVAATTGVKDISFGDLGKVSFKNTDGADVTLDDIKAGNISVATGLEIATEPSQEVTIAVDADALKASLAEGGDAGTELNGLASGNVSVSYNTAFENADGTKGRWEMTADGKTVELTAAVANGALTLSDAGGNALFTIDKAAGATLDATEKDYQDVFANGKTVAKLGNDPTVTGTINGATQNIQLGTDGGDNRVANTTIDLSEYFQKDGTTITLGDTTYTIAVGKDSKFKSAENVIDLTDFEPNNVDAQVAATRLTTVAKNNNGIFSVGHDGKGNTTLQQLSEAKDSTDMTTREKIASYIKISTVDAKSLRDVKTASGLTLQIGDTSDSFNQMSVSIGDMHTDAMGTKGGKSIADINIGNQKGAQEAVQVIKDAINYVSGVRGDLGAVQNRLEHTANNLSVMAENIQDAESTIRDTDIAEEMMSYTKNNILVQSAQAMLAQANAVPQGVLQLLG